MGEVREVPACSDMSLRWFDYSFFVFLVVHLSRYGNLIFIIHAFWYIVLLSCANAGFFSLFSFDYLSVDSASTCFGHRRWKTQS
jgi:hypothetical protein